MDVGLKSRLGCAGVESVVSVRASVWTTAGRTGDNGAD